MLFIKKDGEDMDYTEIMNFCGFDLEKSHEMVIDRPPVEYNPEMIEEAMKEVGLETLRK